MKEKTVEESRSFPDATSCRTRHVYGEVYKCLAADGCRCPHALAFAFSYYCRHPDGRTLHVVAGWYLPDVIAVTA